MARGGVRPGAGRKPGSVNKVDSEFRKRAAESGITPLDYMLAVLRDDTKPADVRFEAAKAAAPYVHARLSAAEIKQETTVRYVARIPEKQPDTDSWQQRHAPSLQ